MADFSPFFVGASRTIRLLLEEVVLAAFQVQTFWPLSCSGFATKSQKSSWQFYLSFREVLLQKCDGTCEEEGG